jgi:hypothetical protein
MFFVVCRRTVLVEGSFVWRLLATPRSAPNAGRVGESAQEFVRGTFAPHSGLLKFQGFAISAGANGS